MSLQPTQILYLDFDGVLHPADVRRYRRAPAIRLEAPGHALFESCETLEQLLEPYPDVRVVLSTSWVRVFGFRNARSYLTPGLLSRVIGATFHKRYHHKEGFALQSRFHQVMDDVHRRQPAAWLAVDDDAEGWPDANRCQLALTPKDFGLSAHAAQEELRQRLRAHFGLDIAHSKASELRERCAWLSTRA